MAEPGTESYNRPMALQPLISGRGSGDNRVLLRILRTGLARVTQATGCLLSRVNENALSWVWMLIGIRGSLWAAMRVMAPWSQLRERKYSFARSAIVVGHIPLFQGYKKEREQVPVGCTRSPGQSSSCGGKRLRRKLTCPMMAEYNCLGEWNKFLRFFRMSRQLSRVSRLKVGYFRPSFGGEPQGVCVARLGLLRSSVCTMVTRPPSLYP